MKPREPRIAFIDIETSPILMTAWQPYEANAVWIERDTHLLSFAVKWSDRHRVTTHALPDYSGYRKNRHNDCRLVHDLWKVMNEADIIVAHNGDSFDIKKINSRLAVHGFQPPAPYKTIDTLKIARKHFKFDSNKLDNLGRYLGVGRKIPNSGAHLWRGCVNGDAKSWRIMRRYNAQDVRLLEAVYLRLRGWASTHPDLRPYAGPDGCPTCQSTNIQRRGIAVKKSHKYQRFQCTDCGAWFSGESIPGDRHEKAKGFPKSAFPQKTPQVQRGRA